MAQGDLGGTPGPRVSRGRYRRLFVLAQTSQPRALILHKAPSMQPTVRRETRFPAGSAHRSGHAFGASFDPSNRLQVPAGAGGVAARHRGAAGRPVGKCRPRALQGSALQREGGWPALRRPPGPFRKADRPARAATRSRCAPISGTVSPGRQRLE